MKLYLGYDGDYVLSRHALHIQDAMPGTGPFLAPRPGKKCCTLETRLAHAAGLFAELNLAHLEVVRLEVRIQRTRKKKSNKKPSRTHTRTK